MRTGAGTHPKKSGPWVWVMTTEKGYESNLKSLCNSYVQETLPDHQVKYGYQSKNKTES